MKIMNKNPLGKKLVVHLLFEFQLETEAFSFFFLSFFSIFLFFSNFFVFFPIFPLFFHFLVFSLKSRKVFFSFLLKS